MAGVGEKNSRDEDIVIARIVKARGIRGEVSCIVETDFPETFESLGTVAVLLPDGARLNLNVENHWFHNDRVILKFEGYDSMTAAQDLTGGRLMIAESQENRLEEGQFFERQVIGSEVVASDGQRLGEVVSVMRTGGTDVLVVSSDDGKERLIPFADEICTDVDTDLKRITVDPPEGLLDL